jgi:hypothetical protein
MTALAAPRRAGPLDLGPLLDELTGRLQSMQHLTDGPFHHRGEFPMQLWGPVTRADHNYLSGYALLHLIHAEARLPPAARAPITAMLDRAADVPAHYQTAALTCNWYSGKTTGQRAPAGYPWPDGCVRAVRDDFDDTAVSSMLAGTGRFRLRSPLTLSLFDRARYVPERHPLMPNAILRLELTGCGRDVYRTWVLPEPGEEWDQPPRVSFLPLANTVEMTAVANVVTAVHLLGGDPDGPGQVASAAFVNRLARVGIEKLLVGDASYLDLASSYYPRVPFAPLAYLARDHVATGNRLLEPETTRLLARALVEVSEDAAWRSSGFANRAFWLSCAAWGMTAGMVAPGELWPKVDRVLRQVSAELAPPRPFPDVVFFHASHIGDYGGTPYTLAVLIETFALIQELQSGGHP